MGNILRKDAKYMVGLSMALVCVFLMDKYAADVIKELFNLFIMVKYTENGVRKGVVKLQSNDIFKRFLTLRDKSRTLFSLLFSLGTGSFQTYL